MMDRQYVASVVKDGLLEKSGPSLKRAIKRLNHQAKRHTRRDKERRDWKR